MQAILLIVGVVFLINEALTIGPSCGPVTSSGKPLLLTPFIESGRIEEGQNLSRVVGLSSPDTITISSYSGYFTVNKTHNSNLFFWFFPAQIKPESSPLLLWLQGGPGGSSLFGLFVEHGPLVAHDGCNLTHRKYNWAITHSVLYIDSPAGTGFSFTDDDAGYATNEEDVARDLYQALTQFFLLFPQYQKLNFYITGESYAGKYVPAISVKIDEENHKSPTVQMNLKGMAIGDAWTDPISLLNFNEYLYNLGIVDKAQQDIILRMENKLKDLILRGEYEEAYEVNLRLMGWGGYKGLMFNLTGLNFNYNFLYEKEPPDHKYYATWVQMNSSRLKIHVGDTPFNDLGPDSKVRYFMRKDILKSRKDLVIRILDSPQNYTVLLYNGQLDYCVTTTGTEKYLSKLEWYGKGKWTSVTKKQWKSGQNLAGWVKTLDNLTFLVVRNSGHMVPYDQPEWAFDLINRFTRGKPFA